MIFILIYSLYKDGSLNCSKHSQKKKKPKKKTPPKNSGYEDFAGPEPNGQFDWLWNVSKF